MGIDPQIRILDAELARLTAETAPALLQAFCIPASRDTASTLLITAGDNAKRLRSMRPSALSPSVPSS